MRQAVFIRVSSQPWSGLAELEWVVRSRSGELSAPQRGTLEHLRPIARQNHTVFLLPGAAVSLFSTQLPNVPANKVGKIIPHALEEQVATDIDDLHFVVTSKDNGLYQVAVIEKALLAEAIDTFHAADIVIDQINAEVFGVPSHDEQSSIVLFDDYALIHSVDGERLVLDTENVVNFQQPLALNDSQLYASSNNPRLTHMLPHVASDGHQIDTHSPLPVIATSLSESRVNFLNGVFAPVSRYAGAFIPWRKVVAFFAIAIVLYVIYQMLAIRELQKEATTLDNNVRQRFKVLMPKEKLRDPAKQIRTTLRTLSAPNKKAATSPLWLLEQVLPALQSSKTNVVQRITYNNNTLAIKLAVRNVNEAEKIARMTKALQTVNVKYSPSTQSNAVTVNLQVSAKGR